MNLRKAVDLMHAGSLLMQMNKAGDARAWYLIPGGEVPDDVAQDLIRRSNVIAMNDGLFPGISQTWKMTQSRDDGTHFDPDGEPGA